MARPVHAATRYVNSDSSGAANNPTRAFNDPSYTANDSYADFPAAYNAASAGDIIEFSGGTTSKTYHGQTFSLQRQNLTLRGSTISGHDGEVIIDYNSGGGTYTVGLNANGMVLDRLTISRQGGTSGQYALRVLVDDAVIRNVKIANTVGFGVELVSAADNTLFENFQADASTIAGANIMNAANGFTMRNALFYGTKLTGIGGISFASSATAYTLDNVVFDGISAGSILPASGSTINLTNCVIVGNGIVTQRVIHFGSGGTVNTTNCFIQGAIKVPDTIVTGSGTWNSTNDTIGQYPYFTRTKENLGYILLGIDDRHNIAHFKTLADYAKTNYGITMSVYVHDTQNLTNTDKSNLQQLYLDGHEIALHSRHHTNMGVVGPMSITYTGAASNIAFVVSSSGTSLSLTGSGDTQGPIDLTAAANDTVGELCTTIEAWTNYTCALTGTVDNPTKSDMPSITLKDASTSLPQNSAAIPPYDDNTGPSNRFLTEEVTNNINQLEAAMHENVLTAGYEAKSFAYPYSAKTTAINDWIRTNTDLVSIRGVGTDSTTSKTSLTNINVYTLGNVYTTDNMRGTGYDALNTAQKEARIRQAARSMIMYAGYGMVTGFVGHNESQDLSVQEWEWMIDELAIYDGIANVQVKSQAEIVSDITTSGSWSNGGSGLWTRTFSGSADFRLKPQSTMINAGTTAAGRTTDIIGNSLVGTPDMGAYEFQAPSAPSSLAQYKSDGSTVITSAAWTNETTVVLKFSMSSSNATDTLTPQVEVRTNATSFTNAATHTGTPVAYSGSPVEGTVTVTGLSSDTIYHWQASATNAAGTSSWTAKGGSPDFGVDTTAPTTPGTPSTTTPTTDTTPTWTWTASTDASSGLTTPAYTVQWSTDSAFNTITGSSTSNTNSFTHSVALAEGTWYFRVRAADAQGNTSSFSSNGSAVVDTTAPTTPGTPSTTTPTSDTTPTWTWAASTDGGAGLASPAYTVEWSTDSGFGVITGSTTAASTTYTHTVALAEGTWYFRVRAADLAGNTSSNSSNGSVVIDATAPTTPGTPSTTSPTSDTTPSWTWTASTDGGSGLATPAYTVQWSTDSAFNTITGSATSNTNSYTHSVTLAGGTWYFRVRAADAAGNTSSFSSNGTVVIDLTGPIISSVNSTPDTTSVDITWTTDEASSSQVNYGTTISYGTDTSLADTSPRVTSHTVNISGLSTCTTYHYRVRSIDSSGNESISTDETFTTTGCVTPTPSPTPTPTPSSSSTSQVSDGLAPGLSQAQAPVCAANAPATAPTLRVVETGANSVRLSWTSVDPVTHYGIYFRRDRDSAEYGASNIGLTTSYTVTNLSGQETYTFEVFGVNDCAPGPRGQAKSGTLSGGRSSAAVTGSSRAGTNEEVMEVISGTSLLKLKLIDAANNPVVDTTVFIPTASNSSRVTNAQGMAVFDDVPLGPQKIQTQFQGQTVTKDVNVDGKRPNETVVFQVAKPSPSPSPLVHTPVDTGMPSWQLGLVGIAVIATVTAGGVWLYRRKQEEA